MAAGTHLNFAPVVEAPNAVAQRNAYSAVEWDETEPDENQILQPDNSLTSLSWLQNFKLHEMFSPEVRLRLLPPSPCSEDAFSWETLSTSSTSQDETKAARDDEMLPLSPIHKCLVQSATFRNEPKKYRNDTAKPPISEASLIYLAMQHSRSGKVTLHHIFRWIKTNFKYFKSANTGWQVGGTLIYM